MCLRSLDFTVLSGGRWVLNQYILRSFSSAQCSFQLSPSLRARTYPCFSKSSASTMPVLPSASFAPTPVFIRAAIVPRALYSPPVAAPLADAAAAGPDHIAQPK